MSFFLSMLLMIFLTVIIGKPLLKFADNPVQFTLWVDSHGISGKFIYFLIVFLQVIFAVIPGEPIEILGGYAFGSIEGTVICLLASAAGSMTVFAFVRRFGINLVYAIFSKEKVNSLKFLHFSKKRDFIVFIIFMFPGTPKDLLSYFVGLTDIKTWVWFLICLFGRIPSVLSSALTGEALGKKSYISAVIIFGITLALCAAGIFIYNFICNKKNQKKAR